MKGTEGFKKVNKYKCIIHIKGIIQITIDRTRVKAQHILDPHC